MLMLSSMVSMMLTTAVLMAMVMMMPTNGQAITPSRQHEK
jgi:hypothetical protein